MRRQKDLFQTQEKTTEKKLNGMEIHQIPDKELKVIVLKILTIPERKADELSENFNKDIENIKKNQS